MDGLVTLIIPTVAARSDLLQRTLRHLRAEAFPGPILISDHSAPDQYDRVEDSVRNADGLAIEVLRHPSEWHFLERIRDAASKAESDFVSLHADDDFMFLDSLSACLDVLREQPDVSLAQGRMVHIRSTQQDGQMQVEPVAYERRNRLEEAPEARVLKHIGNFCSTLYGVHRRHQLIDNLSHTLAHATDVTFWQYLMSAVTAMQGKIRVIEDLHYIREMRPESWSMSLYRERDPDTMPWLLTAPHFSERLQGFKTGVHNFLKKLGRTPGDSFKATEDQAILLLLRRALGGELEEPAEPGESELWQAFQDTGSTQYQRLQKCAQYLADKDRAGE